MEEAANRGDTSGVLGAAAGQALPYVAGAGIQATGEAIPGARAAIGEAIHTPEGKLTPAAKLTSQLGAGGIGAVAGGALGHPEIGGVIGYKAGPFMLDKAFPEPAATVAARNEFLNAKTLTEAQEAAIAQNEKIDAAHAADQVRVQKAAQQAHDDAMAARDQTAQDLMTRQAQQDRLDAAAAKAANAAARAQREGLKSTVVSKEPIGPETDPNAVDYEQRGQDLMNRQRQQDALDRAAKRAAQDAQDARDQTGQALLDRQRQQDILDARHAKALKAVEDSRQKELADNERFRLQHAQALNSRGTSAPEAPAVPTPNTISDLANPQDLISRTKKLVVPGESPTVADLKRAGDMTQVDLPRLKLLAKFGDMLAQNEIIRRQKNP